jgi:hypothetical protein
MALVEWVVIPDRRRKAVSFAVDLNRSCAASESVMREVIGDRTVDEVLTIGRQEIEAQTLVQLKALSGVYGLGVSIMQVQLKNVHPPQGVQSSFNEVNQAQQEREQMINVANGEYNKAVPKARGEADQQLRAAEGYALSRVNEARGDAERFNALLAEYVKAPEVTRQRIYLETMAEVLPGLERKIILDEKAGGLVPLMSLDPRLKDSIPKDARPKPSNTFERPLRMKASVLFLVAVVIAVLVVLSAAIYIVRKLSSDHHAVRQTGWRSDDQIGHPFQGPSSRKFTGSKNGCWNGTAQPPRCRRRTSSTSSSTRSAVGASVIRCSISSGCAMNAAPNRDSTTSLAARRAIRSRAMNWSS